MNRMYCENFLNLPRIVDEKSQPRLFFHKSGQVLLGCICTWMTLKRWGAHVVTKRGFHYLAADLWRKKNKCKEFPISTSREVLRVLAPGRLSTGERQVLWPVGGLSLTEKWKKQNLSYFHVRTKATQSSSLFCKGRQHVTPLCYPHKTTSLGTLGQSSVKCGDYLFFCSSQLILPLSSAFRQTVSKREGDALFFSLLLGQT